MPVPVLVLVLVLVPVPVPVLVLVLVVVVVCGCVALPEWSVKNRGVPGYGPVQAWLALERHVAEGTAPDVMIVGYASFHDDDHGDDDHYDYDYDYDDYDHYYCYKLLSSFAQPFPTRVESTAAIPLSLPTRSPILPSSACCLLRKVSLMLNIVSSLLSKDFRLLHKSRFLLYTDPEEKWFPRLLSPNPPSNKHFHVTSNRDVPFL